MKSGTRGEIVRKSIWILLLLAIPLLASGQDKPKKSSPPPAPSKPAPTPHSAAPTHSTAPSASTHTTSPTHTTAPTHTTSPTGTAGKTGTSTMGKPGTSTAGKPRTSAATAGKGGTMAGVKSAGSPMSKTAMSKPAPGRQVSLKGGGTANIRPNGKIRSVDRNGMHIEHAMHGSRTVVSTHNGARVVTTGAHGGYVQRAYFSRNGQTYVSRTYVVNNVSYTNVYRSYSYGGYCCYYGYAPAYYYQPVYYGWAYNPWPAPVAYGWGWGGAPWYGYYGPYFEPYPVYPSAAFWITDFLIAASLQAAYEAQAEAAASGQLMPDYSGQLVASLGLPPAAAAGSTAVALTPEAKQAVADEVKAQLADDQAESQKKGASSGQAASSEAPPALDPKRRTFVISSEVDTTDDGEECSLTAGDVISRVSDTPDGDKNVTVKVLASKKTDCAVGKQVPVSVDDLQEMHNKFREQVGGGMGELAKKNGTGGLPKAPDTSTTAGDVPPPPPDKTAQKSLQDQQSAADQTETQVKQEAGAGSSGGAQ
jgi:hypothetical protein